MKNQHNLDYVENKENQPLDQTEDDLINQLEDDQKVVMDLINRGAILKVTKANNTTSYGKMFALDRKYLYLLSNFKKESRRPNDSNDIIQIQLNDALIIEECPT